MIYIYIRLSHYKHPFLSLRCTSSLFVLAEFKLSVSAIFCRYGWCYNERDTTILCCLSITSLSLSPSPSCQLWLLYSLSHIFTSVHAGGGQLSIIHSQWLQCSVIFITACHFSDGSIVIFLYHVQ